MSSTLGGKLGLTSSSTWDNVVTAITNATVSTVLSFSLASTAYNSITFTWKNPASGGFAGVVIVGKTGSYPSSPTDGTTYYTGLGNNSSASGTSSTTLTAFSGSTTYYFRCWSYVLINNIKWYSDTYKQAIIKTKTIVQKIFTSSTTWTIPNNVTSIDIFCVGGGGGGNGNGNNGKVYRRGGGAGYTATKLKQAVTPGTSYTVTIGAGGSAKYSGNDTSFGNLLSVSGGYSGKFCDGGSGGGAGNTCGGSDGNDSGNIIDSSLLIGIGQHSTTRAFAESSNTLYAGGGGAQAVGGAGGGGRGAVVNIVDDELVSIIQSVAGTTNSGGGGGSGDYGTYDHEDDDDGGSSYSIANPNAAAGGSGICIIRYII